MFRQEVSVLAPPLRSVPRGAVLVGVVIDLVLGVAALLRERAAAWCVAEIARRAAARSARRDVRDRAALMALAHRVESSQPEFAKELFAVAKRDPV